MAKTHSNIHTYNQKQQSIHINTHVLTSKLQFLSNNKVFYLILCNAQFSDVEASLIKAANSIYIFFLSFFMGVINLLIEGQLVQYLGRNCFLMTVYLGHTSTKWYSNSICFWLQNIHNLSFISRLLCLPVYIAKLCADKRNLVS